MVFCLVQNDVVSLWKIIKSTPILMPFTQFKTIGEVVKKYQLSYEVADFVADDNQSIEPPEQLKKDIDEALIELPFDVSEISIGETLIYPILKSVWQAKRANVLLWSHPTIFADDDLNGISDYVFAGKSVYGKVVLDSPLLVMVEAKKDNFTEGWGQCTAQMLAAQKINKDTTQIVYGIVSNGETWEVACLNGNALTRFKNIFTVSDLTELYGVLTNIVK
jgi:hypothetical protein